MFPVLEILMALQYNTIHTLGVSLHPRSSYTLPVSECDQRTAVCSALWCSVLQCTPILCHFDLIYWSKTVEALRYSSHSWSGEEKKRDNFFLFFSFVCFNAMYKNISCSIDCFNAMYKNSSCFHFGCQSVTRAIAFMDVL